MVEPFAMSMNSAYFWLLIVFFLADIIKTPILVLQRAFVKIKNILIIDDSPIARIILKKCITNNYEIEEADSGEKGLDLLADFYPDLVFLDLTMPGIGGFETLDRIKKISPDLPVVVLSADRQQSSITKVLKLGAYGSLPKPPRPEIIKQIIAEIEGQL